MSETFIASLIEARIIPVIRHRDPDIALRACRLLAAEGVRALEVTMSVPGAADMIAKLRAEQPRLSIGAGTVLSEDEARAALAAGAGFIVSPCWSAPVAKAAIGAGIPYLPGAMTPGEVWSHAQAGAAIVKIFPADAAGGPGFLKALKSVFPQIPLMPTGGITPENAAAFLQAGAVCVGMGGNLLPAAELERGDEGAARDRIRAALAALDLKPSWERLPDGTYGTGVPKQTY